MAFRMHGDEISEQGAASFDVCQRLPTPMQEALPQVVEGGRLAFRSDLLKGSKEPWLQPLWRCRFRQQEMVLLSGIYREKGEQSCFGHAG